MAESIEIPGVSVAAAEPSKAVRRGVHVRELMAAVEAAVHRYQRASHSSRAAAARRARTIAATLARRAETRKGTPTARVPVGPGRVLVKW